MKIRMGKDDGPHVDVDVSSYPVTLRDVFCGIGIETDQGRFGIAMRDNGIEVLLNGKLVWSSSEDSSYKDRSVEMSSESAVK